MHGMNTFNTMSESYCGTSNYCLNGYVPIHLLNLHRGHTSYLDEMHEMIISVIEPLPSVNFDTTS